MKGVLVLRIEDTDQARSTRESERMILSDIQSLGLDYQEGPLVGGPHAPYRQSERLSIYASHAQALLDQDQVYRCFCTDDELTLKRQAALKAGRIPHYDGTCARLSPEAVQEKLSQGLKAGLRFRAYQKNYVIQDRVRGRVEFKEGMVGDFLITRTPGQGEKEAQSGIGFPVYNFCCAIDDHLMQISHVIRAEEHLSNTVRQLMIYDAFGWSHPEYAHTALVLGSDRQKLSKRSGDVSVFEYIEKGYLPEVLLNFLILLGWWPAADVKASGGHPEVFTLDELIQNFNLDGFQKAPAVFDLLKLKWMNSYYLHHLPISEIARRARPFFDQVGSPLAGRSLDWFEKVVDAVRGEVSLLSELPQAADVFLAGTPSLAPEAKAVLKDPAALQIVEALTTLLQEAEQELTAEWVGALPAKISAQTGVKGKALFMPIRAITTGRTHGPELKLVLPLLGREVVLRRISELKAQAE